MDKGAIRRIYAVIVLFLSLSILLCAEDKPCLLGNFPPSDGDFRLWQGVVKTTHPFGQPTRHEGHCLYSVRISNGYGTLTAINGPHDSSGTTPVKAWITVHGLKQRHQYTCLLETGNGAAGIEKWEIGDVLWFSADTTVLDDSSLPSVFEHCSEVANMTKDYPKALSKVPK